MLNKEFLTRLWKEMLVAFVVTLGGVILAGSGLGVALLGAAAVAGLRGAVGVVVRNFGEIQNHPSL